MKKAEEKVVSVQEEIETCKSSKEKLSAEFDELGKKGIEVVAKRDEAMVIIKSKLFFSYDLFVLVAFCHFKILIII